MLLLTTLRYVVYKPNPNTTQNYSNIALLNITNVKIISFLENVHKLQNLSTFLGFRREAVPLCMPALTPIIQRIIWGCYGKSMIYQANSHIYFTIVLQFILSQHSIKLLELLIGQIQYRL